MHTWKFCPQGLIIGVDEAGVGPLAGPMVACAVALRNRNPEIFEDLRDSKKMTPKQRDRAAMVISRNALTWRIRWLDPFEVDRAGSTARIGLMGLAVRDVALCLQNLGKRPDLVVVDGDIEISTVYAQKALIGGDDACLEVAAASVMAKVLRDQYMTSLAKTYPGYGWSKNMGYGTPGHIRAIIDHGLTPHHRPGYTRTALETFRAKNADL